jgi:hypothetical protein
MPSMYILLLNKNVLPLIWSLNTSLKQIKIRLQARFISLYK